MEFASTKDGIQYFNDTFGQYLKQALAGSGLYYAVAVGQLCAESGYGNSPLAQVNNFGGIRNFGSLSGAGTIMYQGHGDKSPQPYATFSSPLFSFQKYLAILRDPTKRYTANGVFTATTPQAQLQAIAKSGWCEDPPGWQDYYNGVWPIAKKCLLMYNIGKL